MFLSRPSASHHMIFAAGRAQLSPDLLRVATLNMAHGRGRSFTRMGLKPEKFEENLSAIAACLRREGADMVALQEVDAAGRWSGGFDHVRFLADAAGYAYAYHGRHVDIRRGNTALCYGTALLANRPLVRPCSHAFHTEPTDSKGFVIAEVEFRGRLVTVVSVHLDFKLETTRRRQAAALMKHLRGHPAPIIVLGDFNTTWRRARGALRLLAERWHLHAYDPHSRERNTFPARRPRRRLDWALISDPLSFRDQWSWPDRISDHFGLTAEVRWSPPV